MSPYNDDGPRLEAEAQTPNYPDSTAHDIAMFGMAWRIRWLERHRHWWIRSIREGRRSA
jgi:hypothetical protein